MSRISIVRVELVKERTMNYDGSRKISSADDAARILWQYVGEPDREMFLTIALSTKHYVNAIETVSVGSLNTSIVHPREVFKSAILSNAAGVILGHNHPSGDPEPSVEDIAVTRRLSKAGGILGIDVVDHIILGDGRFVSLRGMGLVRHGD